MNERDWARMGTRTRDGQNRGFRLTRMGGIDGEAQLRKVSVRVVQEESQEDG